MTGTEYALAAAARAIVLEADTLPSWGATCCAPTIAKLEVIAEFKESRVTSHQRLHLAKLGRSGAAPLQAERPTVHISRLLTVQVRAFGVARGIGPDRSRINVS